MNRFRKIWIGIVILMLVLFAVYCIRENLMADSSGPVISLETSEIRVSIHDGDDVLLEGITAEDKKDGDVTDSLIVEQISGFYEDGKRIVTYAAFDSDNHISKVQRELNYTDYVSPKFSINASTRFRTGSSVNIDTIASAEDCLDGDISNKIKIHMDAVINNRVTGLYSVKYSVTNSAGETVTLPVNIEIYEPQSNEIQLNLKTYLVYYTGKDMDYTQYLKSVQKGNREYAFEGVTLLDIPEEQVSDMEDEQTENDTEEDSEEESIQVQSTASKIPKNRVRVDDSYVDPTKAGVYPVYFHYSSNTETNASVAKEVLYVVVE